MRTVFYTIVSEQIFAYPADMHIVVMPARLYRGFAGGLIECALKYRAFLRFKCRRIIRRRRNKRLQKLLCIGDTHILRNGANDHVVAAYLKKEAYGAYLRAEIQRSVELRTRKRQHLGNKQRLHIRIGETHICSHTLKVYAFMRRVLVYYQHLTLGLHYYIALKNLADYAIFGKFICYMSAYPRIGVAVEAVALLYIGLICFN